uniref:LAGLIDADG endonuclease n=1 Tax=Chrysoporthe austroafricana TaxID=354353 RepID=A0A191MWN3_9PEZI|nr:LAGLIDADG endonuclease [Chrysoporthe austroafricana]AMX22081.1 LAGLIDADG endonuclease [Chrysoporthe austroafricana]
MNKEWLSMGTFILLFFLCVKKHFARNLLLLSNTNSLGRKLLGCAVAWTVSYTSYLTSFHSQLFGVYNRLLRTRGLIAFVYKNSAVCTSRLYSIIPQQKLRYSSKHNKILPISPWFITGFTDAEGCFNVGFQKNPNGKWYIRPLFQIKVHSRDNLLLNGIKDYFGGIGNIYITSKDSKFLVRSLDEILKIVLHFDNYPLISKKRSDFILFKQIIHKVVEGEHLSAKGLQEIVNIRSAINLGLSDSLKTIFPNTIPVSRPMLEDITIPDPEWMAGFVSGEGCFLVQISKYGKDKLDGVSLSFKVSQHLRDELLLRSFIPFFGCGLFNYHSGKSKLGSGVFVVRKYSDISDKILPFFNDHKIRGVKKEDFEDWARVAELIKSKAHLTEDGVEKIRDIKSGMNTLR